jgi:diguanylate cyclase (GGDEF)-like protein/putative nucleotidyltransferase with HDIG domain
VFHEVLEQQLSGSLPFSVIAFDIDDFKEINDLHGHQAGDDVLRLVAQALRQGTRAIDSVFRVGGEEFFAVLPGLSAEDAHPIAERLRTTVAEACSRLRHPVTLSAGVASFPSHATERDDLLTGADAALYASKRGGKNRTSVAGEDEPRDAEPVDRTVRLELLLRKDADTVTHSIHSAILAVQIARRLGLDDCQIAGLRTAAKLHDIGKIGVPDAILSKPGPLDEEEFRIVKTHPIVGAELLEAWGLTAAATIVRQHHERVDGKGYPKGLRGSEILIESRIVHVADAFMAMTLDRPYRAALSHEQAIAELLRHSGTQFDPDVVTALLEVKGDSALDDLGEAGELAA